MMYYWISYIDLEHSKMEQMTLNCGQRGYYELSTSMETWIGDAFRRQSDVFLIHGQSTRTPSPVDSTLSTCDQSTVDTSLCFKTCSQIVSSKNYCSEFLFLNILCLTLVPFSDSSDNVCIKNGNVSTAYDAIVFKSGWDAYGIAYGKPTTNVHIQEVRCHTPPGITH